ncbi:hypothetical protein VFPFJ_05904 [Purpureocillium lilacinum]|uniref:Uncharacterized protein n=1 Tax=Purpureocillium lilacinum TaxID=33203 RepID=A0A179HHV2_PURLI|nr:hypothetical protein VFPFJ_05904 [Purpureocillium lilacinum]OAQ89492.1 hypothetical protein VFPFJ_05904 [Purpureocillium lilacinum]
MHAQRESCRCCRINVSWKLDAASASALQTSCQMSSLQKSRCCLTAAYPARLVGIHSPDFRTQCGWDLDDMKTGRVNPVAAEQHKGPMAQSEPGSPRFAVGSAARS